MLKIELRVSQKEAVEKGMQYDGFLLIHEQRVGKTSAALAMVDRRKPDVLLIYFTDEANLYLERMGSHSELF